MVGKAPQDFVGEECTHPLLVRLEKCDLKINAHGEAAVGLAKQPAASAAVCRTSDATRMHVCVHACASACMQNGLLYTSAS